MSREYPTADERALWAARGREYAEALKTERKLLADSVTGAMVDAVVDGTGWAGNPTVEIPMSRLITLNELQTLADRLLHHLNFNDATHDLDPFNIDTDPTRDED